MYQATLPGSEVIHSYLVLRDASYLRTRKQSCGEWGTDVQSFTFSCWTLTRPTTPFSMDGRRLTKAAITILSIRSEVRLDHTGDNCGNPHSRRSSCTFKSVGSRFLCLKATVWPFSYFASPAYDYVTSRLILFLFELQPLNCSQQVEQM